MATKKTAMRPKVMQTSKVCKNCGKPKGKCKC